VDRSSKLYGRYRTSTMNLSSLNPKLTSLPRISYGSRVRPARDWVVLVVSTIVLLAGLAVFATWEYLEGAKADPILNLPTTSNTISPEALKETEALFAERAAEAQRFQSEYQFVDPSL